MRPPASLSWLRRRFWKHEGGEGLKEITGSEAGLLRGRKVALCSSGHLSVGQALSPHWGPLTMVTTSGHCEGQGTSSVPTPATRPVSGDTQEPRPRGKLAVRRGARDTSAPTPPTSFHFHFPKSKQTSLSTKQVSGRGRPCAHEDTCQTQRPCPPALGLRRAGPLPPPAARGHCPVLPTAVQGRVWKHGMTVTLQSPPSKLPGTLLQPSRQLSLPTAARAPRGPGLRRKRSIRRPTGRPASGTENDVLSCSNRDVWSASSHWTKPLASVCAERTLHINDFQEDGWVAAWIGAQTDT